MARWGPGGLPARARRKRVPWARSRRGQLLHGSYRNSALVGSHGSASPSGLGEQRSCRSEVRGRVVRSVTRASKFGCVESAALVISILALVVSIASAYFSKRQAVAASGQANAAWVQAQTARDAFEHDVNWRAEEALQTNRNFRVTATPIPGIWNDQEGRLISGVASVAVTIENLASRDSTINYVGVRVAGNCRHSKEADTKARALRKAVEADPLFGPFIRAHEKRFRSIKVDTIFKISDEGASLKLPYRLASSDQVEFSISGETFWGRLGSNRPSPNLEIYLGEECDFVVFVSSTPLHGDPTVSMTWIGPRDPTERWESKKFRVGLPQHCSDT